MKWSAELDGELRARYLTHTRRQIADELGLTEGQVRSRFWTLGMAAKVRPWSEDDIAGLRHAYERAVLNSDVDLPALAATLGRDKANVCRKARELGLTKIARKRVLKRADARMYETTEALRAAQSESAKKRIAENGHPRGALGMKHTEATKETLRLRGREHWESLTNDQQGDHILKVVRGKRAKGVPFAGHPRGSWKAGWREIGGQRAYFRSRWEANYARYLEWLRSIGQISSWEHEPHTFWFEGIKRGCVSYLPDFRVINPGGSIEWHEVKGWMDDRSKTVIRRMGKYHPKEKLVVIAAKEYREILRKVSALIHGWEA